MANWESYRIADIISEIDDRKIVLPVIQRRLVWDEEKMELLFDTLLKGDSFGGIMVIKEDKNDEPLFSFRPFTKDGEPIDSMNVEKISQNQSFVIDGQQRLQSFYIGLSGTFNGKILYFDLFSNYKNDFDFKFEIDQAKLPREAKDDSSRIIKRHKWHSVSDLLRHLKQTGNDKTTAKKIIATEKITDPEEMDHILENVGAFYRGIIANKSLGICEVSLDKTADAISNRQRIVELFRRLNDGGTRLSPFDLVASILKGFEWRMESFLENTLANYRDIGLSQDNLIKLVFLLQDNNAKEMTEIDAGDARFVIENSERIDSTLLCLRQFLHEADLYNYYKDSNRSFIPLFFICYHIFHKDISNKDVIGYFDNCDASNPDFPRMKKWIYLSLINGVFRSKGAGWIPYKTGIRKILKVIIEHKNNVFPCDELLNVYKEHGVMFTTSFNSEMLDDLESSFLYYLIYDRKLVVRVQDVDHVMPKSLLVGLGFEWDKINSVRNFQLLDSGTNRGEKNAKPFFQWLTNFVTDKPAFTLKHLIPNDTEILHEEKFEQFISKRADLILEKVNKYVN